MDRGLITGTSVLILSLCLGCGGSDTAPLGHGEKPADSASNASASNVNRGRAKGPMAEAARGFLEAVIAGDTQQATGWLTPQAVQQIESSGKAFSPPGLETANYRIGEVLNVSPTQAFVQCYLTNDTGDQQTQEEMCCVVKQVGNRWLISGIAFQLAPNRPPFILDFEKPAVVGPTQQMVSQPATGSPATVAPQTPRTAAGNDSLLPR